MVSKQEAQATSITSAMVVSFTVYLFEKLVPVSAEVRAVAVGVIIGYWAYWGMTRR